MHSDMWANVPPGDWAAETSKADSSQAPAHFFPQGKDRFIFGNALFANRGGGRFDEVSDAAGVETYWPWGPSVDDLNADGTPNTEAIRVEIDATAFTGGAVNFRFKADTLTIQIAGFLNITAVDFTIDTSTIEAYKDPSTPQATKDKLRLVQFGSISAKVKIGSFEIGGEARNFGFDPTGTFKAGDPNDINKLFGIFLSVGSADGSSIGWPTWLPVKINSLGVIFHNIPDPINPTGPSIIDFSDFEIVASVSVTTGTCARASAARIESCTRCTAADIGVTAPIGGSN